MTAQAYLVAAFDATATPPTLIGVSIHSSGWSALTLAHSPNRFYADLAVGNGDNYTEACVSLLRYVDVYPGLAWVRGRVKREADRVPPIETPPPTSGSALVDVYKDQVTALWHARQLAQDFGPRVRGLPQEEEALRAECLELLWDRMGTAERELVEAWVAANRPEVRPFDSDGWPQTPEPPRELMVVPVMLRNGEWAWFQGAPDGVRYALVEAPLGSVSE